MRLFMAKSDLSDSHTDFDAFYSFLSSEVGISRNRGKAAGRYIC